MHPLRWLAAPATWIDRRLWVAVPLAFLGVELAQVTWATLSERPVLLARSSSEVRADLYSSLTGSSGALLGFTIAAVAILVTFAPRHGSGVDVTREDNLGRARRKLVGVLLATAAALGFTLVCATLALGIDRGDSARSWLEQLVVSGAVASMLGLTLGGLGFTLAVLERRTQ